VIETEMGGERERQTEIRSERTEPIDRQRERDRDNERQRETEKRRGKEGERENRRVRCTQTETAGQAERRVEDPAHRTRPGSGADRDRETSDGRTGRRH
jgi:hypothetical protein